MEKKNASLITMITLGIYAVMSFMPIVYVEKYFEALYESPGAYRESNSWYCNAYIANIRFLAIVGLIFAVIGIVGMFFHYTGKEHKYLKYGTYAPIGTFAIFAIMSAYELNHINPIGEPVGYYTKGSTGYFRFDAGWGFYILIALLIVAAALSYMIATGKNIKAANSSEISRGADGKNIIKQPQSAVTNVAHSSESFDELIKYKELLDSGIITAEEFAKKKEQILGLTTRATVVDDKKDNLETPTDNPIFKTENEEEHEVVRKDEVDENGQV